MKQKSPSVLVTGAHGLAGHAVTAHLASQGYEVIPLDRSKGDLRNPFVVHELFEATLPDYVFHAAATVYGLGGNMANQGKAFYDNTLINTNVIHAAHLTGVKKVIAMGSNCVYPSPPKLPYQVEDIFNGRPDVGEYGYGHAKRHMLAMLEAYKDSYDLNFNYLVSGNLYGPNDKFDTETGHVIPSLIKKFYDATCYSASGGDRYVTVWGDGMASRDFLYSKDLARIVKIMIEEPRSGAINIGNGSQATIHQVCELLCHISGLPLDHVQFDTSKPTGRPDCYADLSALRNLDFTPNWSLQDGLRATFLWYKAKQDHLTEVVGLA